MPPEALVLPEPVLAVFRDCRREGARALLVGGVVRDALRGQAAKDLDVEVHGLSLDALRRLLRRHGQVNEVGRSFGVLKLRLPEGGAEIDVSVPRRDSRIGVGHRGIQADADPFLGVVEAARRRDLTINAIAYDPLANCFEDPFEGRRDLRDGVLRAVDAATFVEDPLRALRVAQFAARFGFTVAPDLEELCTAMPLEELPAERVRGEVEKLLLKAPRPSVGWVFARRTHMWARVIPEWDHEAPSLDRCAALPVSEPARRLALMLGAAGEGLDVAATERVLDRLWVHRVDGYPVRRQVLFMAEQLAAARAGLDDSRLRRLADHGELELLCLLADRGDLVTRARALGIARDALPPLLLGRHVTRLGVEPGPRMGEWLARVREEQLEGRLHTREEAVDWLRSVLPHPPSP